MDDTNSYWKNVIQEDNTSESEFKKSGLRRGKGGKKEFVVDDLIPVDAELQNQRDQ